MRLTPRSFIAGSIGSHEGVLSLHPADNGNWFDPKRYAAKQPQRRNLGKLVGSKFGITAYALADFKGYKDVTKEMIAGITFDLAVDIGVANYYEKTGLQNLSWNRVTASVLDKAWLSGPVRAILMVQELVGAGTDGKISKDGETARKFDAMIAKYGEEKVAQLWADKRIAFDTYLASNQGPNDPDKKFLNGWNNRTRSFLPGTKWWKDSA